MFNPGAPYEGIGCEVRGGARSRRCITDLLRLRFRIGDEFRQRARRHLAVHHQEQRNDADRRNRNEIAQRVVRHVPVEIWIDDDISGVGDAECVAVGRRLRNMLHRDIAAGAGAIVDHHGLAGLGGDRRPRGCGRKGRSRRRRRSRPRCGSASPDRGRRRRNFRRKPQGRQARAGASCRRTAWRE